MLYIHIYFLLLVIIYTTWLLQLSCVLVKHMFHFWRSLYALDWILAINYEKISSYANNLWHQTKMNYRYIYMYVYMFPKRLPLSMWNPVNNAWNAHLMNYTYICLKCSIITGILPGFWFYYVLTSSVWEIRSLINIIDIYTQEQ